MQRKTVKDLLAVGTVTIYVSPLYGFLTFTRYSDIVKYTGNDEGGRSW